MGDWKLETPVAFFIFKRPDVTEKVFREIARARPVKLFVVADGPRKNKPGEAEACAATRAIIDRVDWDCEVLTNYSDVNMGGPLRFPSGLDWVFENTEEAIILEDDCLPHPTFFRFCEEILERYRHDTRITMASGNNFLFGQLAVPFSYYFSHYALTWGWATWRRAWRNFDPDMKTWPEIRDGGWLEGLVEDKGIVKYWTPIFNAAQTKKKFHWDYGWIFSTLSQNALTVVPNVNLVVNIGFGSLASHTTDVNSPLAHMKTREMTFPLVHPPFVLRHRKADILTWKNRFAPSEEWYKVWKGILYHLVRDKKIYALYRRLRRDH